jgi:hypothetical protein
MTISYVSGSDRGSRATWAPPGRRRTIQDYTSSHLSPGCKRKLTWKMLLDVFRRARNLL